MNFNIGLLLYSTWVGVGWQYLICHNVLPPFTYVAWLTLYFWAVVWTKLGWEKASCSTRKEGICFRHHLLWWV